MKTSIMQTGINHFGLSGSMKMIRDAGFDGVDYQLAYEESLLILQKEDFEQFFKQSKEYADEIGLEISQVHAPYPSWVAHNTDEDNEKIIDNIQRAIVATGILGSKYLVVHPPVMPQRRFNDFKAENQELGIRFYERLKPLAKKTGIKIALENMWNYDEKQKDICPTTLSTPEELMEWNDILGREQFTVCLDIGHSALTDPNPAEVIRKLGDYIELLHVHDVDGKSDLHATPLLVKHDWKGGPVIVWDDICQALADINYQGVLNFESYLFGQDVPVSVMQDGFNLQAKLARFLANQIEKKKQA